MSSSYRREGESAVEFIERRVKERLEESKRRQAEHARRIAGTSDPKTGTETNDDAHCLIQPTGVGDEEPSVGHVLTDNGPALLTQSIGRSDDGDDDVAVSLATTVRDFEAVESSDEAIDRNYAISLLDAQELHHQHGVASDDDDRLVLLSNPDLLDDARRRLDLSAATSAAESPATDRRRHQRIEALLMEAAALTKARDERFRRGASSSSAHNDAGTAQAQEESRSRLTEMVVQDRDLSGSSPRQDLHSRTRGAPDRWLNFFPTSKTTLGDDTSETDCSAQLHVDSRDSALVVAPPATVHATLWDIRNQSLMVPPSDATTIVSPTTRVHVSLTSPVRHAPTLPSPSRSRNGSVITTKNVTSARSLEVSGYAEPHSSSEVGHLTLSPSAKCLLRPSVGKDHHHHSLPLDGEAGLVTTKVHAASSGPRAVGSSGTQAIIPQTFWISVWPGFYRLAPSPCRILVDRSRCPFLQTILEKAAIATRCTPAPRCLFTPTGGIVTDVIQLSPGGHYLICPSAVHYSQSHVPDALLRVLVDRARQELGCQDVA